MASLVEAIALDLGVPVDLVTDALAKAHTRFKKLRIPKKSGGFREAVQPSVDLKLVHYWLTANVLVKLPVHSAARAFSPGCSIKANAQSHSEARFAVRIDFKDFFPSILVTDLLRVLRKSPDPKIKRFSQGDGATLIRQACFLSNGRLPIGYPTSPRISNVVMHEIDKRITEKIAQSPKRFGQSTYTRYADDIVFSTDKPGACDFFCKTLVKMLASVRSPSLTVNHSKTRFMSRSGGSTLITGLRIGMQGNVTLHRTYKDQVRLLLGLYSQGRLRAEDHSVLRGHLAYVEAVDGHFLTRLAFRYARHIDHLRSGQ